MDKRSEILQAALLGTEAFSMGKPSAPALNPQLMAMLKGKNASQPVSGEASSLEIMNAYSSSWTAANLADARKHLQ